MQAMGKCPRELAAPIANVVLMCNTACLSQRVYELGAEDRGVFAWATVHAERASDGRKSVALLACGMSFQVSRFVQRYTTTKTMEVVGWKDAVGRQSEGIAASMSRDAGSNLPARGERQTVKRDVLTNKPIMAPAERKEPVFKQDVLSERTLSEVKLALERESCVEVLRRLSPIF